MKNALVMPVLAAVLFTAACKGDGDPTTVGTTASVRFFNATTGMTGSGGFTANGRFATGSALALGQSTQGCAKIDAGSTSFGFGAANPGGTSLSGSALATLNNQSITAGGNYTVVATGSAASPQLYVLDNTFSGLIYTNQAAVRFVNLAPGPATIPNILYVLTGGLPPSGALFAGSLLVGSPSEFQTVTSGPTTFTALIGHQLETRSDATLDLQAGTVNTVAIIQKTASDPLEMVNLPRC